MSDRLWLWKNFVNGKPEYWAFDNPFPIHLDSDDPQTLGEPCGYAVHKPSRRGRPDVSDEQALARIKSEDGDKITRLRARVAQSEAESDAWQKGAMECCGERNTLLAKWGIESDESLTECVERNIDGWKQRALKAEARIAELEAAQEWRPIESAPRETWIIGWHEDLRGFVIKVPNNPQPDDVVPTHWLPLPAPPKVAT